MSKSHYLALCAVAKDETPFLREWVEYHALIGVERFIVYDHESAVPVAETLADHVATGLVTVVRLQGFAIQLPAYNHCLQQFGGLCQWIGFIDLDEFVWLAPPQTDLRLILADYEDRGGLGLSWAVYGSSGHLRRPAGLQIENYLERYPLDHRDDIHIKSFVRPDRAVRAANPHCFEYQPGFHCVNETAEPVNGPFGPHLSSRARVNHYFFRSQEDFCRKLEKGRADSLRLIRNPGEFQDHLSEPVVRDETMLEPARRLKALSASGASAVRAWAGRFEAPLEPSEAVAKADALFAQGRATEAGVTLVTARLRHPDAQAVHLALARFHRAQGRPDQALASAHAALGLEMSLEPYQEILRAQAALGRRDAAANTLRFILHIAKRHDNPPDVIEALRVDGQAVIDETLPPPAPQA